MSLIRIPGLPETFALEENHLWGLFKSPLISAEIVTTAAATTEALAIPAGMLVHRVGLLVTEAIAGGSPDIDLGDGAVTDRYLDAVAATIVNAFVAAPTDSGHLGGFYYGTSDTIDLKVTTKSDTTGKVRVVAWVSYLGL